MLLTRKHAFKNDMINLEIFKHMGYSAFKLWNVGNYEKRNYKELGTEVIEPKKDNGRYLSIDLGIKNTFTCYDSSGTSFILKGFLEATHYCNKKIAYYKVNDYIHKATRYIADYCHENDINNIVIGDIKGIRKDNNIARNNQQLHSLPYAKIYNLLEYKLKLQGITMIKQKEAYSSQCSPNSKDVSKKYAVNEAYIWRVKLFIMQIV